MPAAPDHFRFARTQGNLCGAALARSTLIVVGTQGPDPFYFKGALPWRKRVGKERARKFADFAHGSPPDQVFGPIASYATRTEGPVRQGAFAFLYGLTLHYALDALVHPYVYSCSGFDAQGGLSGPYEADHIRFETGITEAASIELRLHSKENSPREILTATDADLRDADRILVAAFPDRLEPGDFFQGWIDMVDALGLLWDPFGIKGFLGDLIGLGSSRERAMMRPGLPKLSYTVDYLNTQRCAWTHPTEGDERWNSVADLTSKASEVANRAAQLVDAIALGADPREGWDRLAGGIDHEGRSKGQRLTFQRSIHEVRV